MRIYRPVAYAVRPMSFTSQILLFTRFYCAGHCGKPPLPLVAVVFFGLLSFALFRACYLSMNKVLALAAASSNNPPDATRQRG